VCVCVYIYIHIYIYMYIRFWWGDLKEVNHLEDLGLDGRIIENGSSRHEIGWHGLDCSWLRIKTVGGRLCL